jgi:hypothetical protein
MRSKNIEIHVKPQCIIHDVRIKATDELGTHDMLFEVHSFLHPETKEKSFSIDYATYQGNLVSSAITTGSEFPTNPELEIYSDIALSEAKAMEGFKISELFPEAVA